MLQAVCPLQQQISKKNKTDSLLGTCDFFLGCFYLFFFFWSCIFKHFARVPCLCKTVFLLLCLIIFTKMYGLFFFYYSWFCVVLESGLCFQFSWFGLQLRCCAVTLVFALYAIVTLSGMYCRAEQEWIGKDYRINWLTFERKLR